MTSDSTPADVVAFVDTVVRALDSGESLPSFDHLTGDDRKLAYEVLQGLSLDIDESLVANLADSDVAVETGLANTPPPHAIDTESVVSLAEEFGPRRLEDAIVASGSKLKPDRIKALVQGYVHLASPDIAALLARILRVPLGDVVRDDIGPIGGADLHQIANRIVPHWKVEDDAFGAVLTSPGHRLGVLATGFEEAGRLNTLTVRRVVWSRLTGPWLSHTACLVVSPLAGFESAVISASDCVASKSAPSGLLHYSDVESFDDPAEALDAYRKRFEVHWSPSPRISSGALDQGYVVKSALSGVDSLLTGSFRQPKKAAWESVRDRTKDLAPSAWESFVGITDADEMVEQIDLFLEQL